MFYRATVRKDGKFWLVSFADCEGCFTQGDTRAQALSNAQEALEGWLEAHLVQGNVPPKPRARKGDEIKVSPQLSTVLQIRWQRAARGLTQGQLAKLAGVSQQQIAKLEDPDGNPTVATLQKIAEALRLRLEIKLSAA